LGLGSGFGAGAIGARLGLDALAFALAGALRGLFVLGVSGLAIGLAATPKGVAALT